MSLVPSAAFQNIEIKFNRGIDGENSVAETEDGFALDVVNADISLPHLAQKRGGYNVYGSQLPVRAVADELGNIQYDRNSSEIRTAVVSLNDGSIVAALGSEYAAFDDSLNTLVCYLAGNTRLLTKNSLIRGIGREFFSPVHVYNEEYVLLPRRFANSGSYVGTVTLSEGPTNLVVDEADIATLTQTDSTTVVLTPSEGTILPLKVGAAVMFESGLTRTVGTTPVTGRVSAATDLAVTITLAAVFVGNVTTNFFRMRYINGQTITLDGKNESHFTTQPPNVVSVNGIGLVLDSALVSTIFFLYGTGVNVGAVTALNTYTTEVVSELVTACSGFIFREVGTRNNITECATFSGSRTVSDQTVTAVANTFTFNIANGIFGNTISKVQAGDTVYWRLAQNTTNSAEVVEYEVTASTLTTITVAAAGRTTLFVPETTQIHYIRTSAKIYISQTTADNYALWVGRCVQPDSLTFQTAHYKIEHVIWPATAATTERSITLNESIAWSSETVFKLLSYFAPVWRPDTSIDVEPIIALSEYDTTVDMPTELFDFSLYFATFNNGTWRYNGSQIISAKLPAPPTPLIRNVLGSGGTLQVVQGENNERIGRRYNFIVTYSYFETIDGVSRKIESGITPETDVSIVARPALDGSLGSQKVELQVASIPRGIGLPAETMFINVYRTLEGIDESGVDGGQYLLERSIRNNPDRPFTSIIVGDVPEFDFNNANADRLYTTIQSGATGALPNNASAPDSRYLVNFANRLLAVNCAKDPSLTFVCQKVFDTLTNNFKAHGLLEVFKDGNTFTPYARFVTCPVGLSTTSGSGFAFQDLVGNNGINYYVASLSTIAVTAIDYDDQAHIFTLNASTAAEQNIIALRYIKKSRTPASLYDIDFEGQTFKSVGSSGGTTLIRSTRQKLRKIITDNPQFITFVADALKTGDVIAQPSATVGFFVQMQGLVKQDDVVNKAVAVQPLYIERDDINSTTLLANNFFVVQGLGTSLQILESANGRAYDLDREIVFQRVNSGTNRIQVKLFVVSDSRLTYLETYFCNQIVTNQSGGAINQQFTILKMFSTVSGSGKNFVVSPTSLGASYNPPPATATITTAVHGIVTVNANTYISIAGIGQIPSDGGVNYSGTFKVVSVISPTKLEIQISPSSKIWRSLAEGGSEGTKTGLTGTAVLPQVAFFVNTATSIKINISPFTLGGTRNLSIGSFVFIYAAGVDENSHSLQLSGYFKTVAIYTAAGGTQGAAPGDSVTAIEIETDVNAIDFGALSALSNTRIVIMTQLETIGALSVLNRLGYIPVPVPLTTIDDVVSPMFSPSAADTTPLAKVIKRFALALNSTLGTLGFAYWGGAVTSNSEPFPANGFKFVARTIAATTFKLTSRRDTQIPGEGKSIFILEGATKIENVDDVFTSDTTGLLRELNPNRVYWTDAASIELSNTAPSFKDNAFFKDLPSADGEVLTGAKVFQNFLLLMKPNGVIRAQFNGNDLLFERVQSPVGTVAYKNIVDNEDGCYFVHSSGVYVTDGYTVTPVMKLKEPFRKFVQPNISLLRETAGVNDNVYKEVLLGIPYNEEGEASKADNQFVFNYFDNVKGWTRNTQFDARWWVKRSNRRYFAGNNGYVYVMRYEDSPSKYRDDEIAIPFRLKTAFLATSNKVTYKFFREMVLQFGAEAESAITIGYLTNYNRNETTLETFVVEASGYGFDPYGVTAWGGDGDVKQIRRSVLPNRAQQVAFTIENEIVDQNVQVYGVYAAAEMGSNTMTKQNKS